MTKELPAILTESGDICTTCHQPLLTATATCSHGAAGDNLLNDEDPLVGTVFADRYEILRLIGKGSTGKVYKAKHQLMKRLVAIKVLHPALVLETGTLKRFQREAESASRLDHPNVVAVHDFGLSPVAYLVMDYLEGVSLEDLLETHIHLDFERSLRIFVQVCAGLAHAHRNSIIHRDLKPSNIMLVKSDGQPDLVKIVDFGIAKVRLQGEVESNQLTLNGEILGTPHYMSPEQCYGKELDVHSDIYSLGCVMYRTLTGVQPIEGQSVVECMYKHIYSTPELFQNVCSELNLSEAVERLVAKAMAKEQLARFKSMSELKEALESLQVGTLAGAEALNAAAREVSPVVPEQSHSLATAVSPDLLPEATGSCGDQPVNTHEPGTNLKIAAGASGRIASAAEAGRAASVVEAGLVASAVASCRAASAAEAGLAANAQEAGRVAAAAETKRAASAVEAGFAAVANEAGLVAVAAESARTASVAEAERAALAAEIRRAAVASELERVAAVIEVGRVVAAAEADRAAAAFEAGRAAAATEAERAALAAEVERAIAVAGADRVADNHD